MSKALFLDRDGVINVNHGYVCDIDNFEFIDGIFALVRQANQQGYKVIVVTNQSGIGRGFYTEDDFENLSAWMCDVFAENHASIDGVYFCPHHPEQAKGDYLQVCQCRKPAPAMFLQAAKEHQINLAESIMVGDKQSDMQAAERAGIKRRILFSQDSDQLSSHHTEHHQSSSLKNLSL